MSLRDIEKKILNEAKVTFNNPKLQLKDIIEWSTSEVAVEDGLERDEVMALLGGQVVGGTWVAIDSCCDKRPKS